MKLSMLDTESEVTMKDQVFKNLEYQLRKCVAEGMMEQANPFRSTNIYFFDHKIFSKF